MWSPSPKASKCMWRMPLARPDESRTRLACAFGEGPGARRRGGGSQVRGRSPVRRWGGAP